MLDVPVQWPVDFHKSIIDELIHQRENGTFCDVILVWNGNRYFAHRCILSAASKFFSENLNGLKISRETFNLDLPSGEYLEDFISFLYTGIAKINPENVEEMMLFSNSFDVPSLSAKCTDFMQETLDVGNCVRYKSICESFNLHEIGDLIAQFINENSPDVFSSITFMELSVKTVRKLFVDKAIELNTMTQLGAKLEAIFRWLEFSHRARERSLRELLRTLRLNPLDPVDIITSLLALADLISCKGCLKAIKTFLLTKYQKIHLVDYDLWNSFLDVFDIRDPPVMPIVNELELKNAVVDTVQNMVSAVSEANEAVFDVRLAYQSFLTNSVPSHEADGDLSPVAKRRKRKSSVPRKVRVKREEFEYSDFDIANGESSDTVDPIISFNLRKTTRRRLPKSRMVQCQECNFKTTDDEKLEKHVKKKHETPSLYGCHACALAFETCELLFEHLKEHYEGPPYVCETEACGMSVDAMSKLWRHIISHHPHIKPYQCINCDQRFRQKCHLNIHMRVHSGDKPFQCKVCDRKFTQKGSLDIHQAVHTDDRPFLCDTCGFATKYKSHFMIHKKIHTGEVYRCSQCDYFSPKRQLLAAHMRYHLSIRSFVCATCGRAFFEKSHLVRHERIHLSEKPFACTECEYCTTRRDKLKEHTKKYHSGTEPSTPQRAPRARGPRKDTVLRRSKLAPPSMDLHQPPTTLPQQPIMSTSTSITESSPQALHQQVTVAMQQDDKQPQQHQSFYATQPTFLHQQIDPNGQIQFVELPPHMMVATVSQPNIQQQQMQPIDQQSQQQGQSFGLIRPTQQMVPTGYPTLMQSELGLGALMQQLFTTT